jgi:hypothetical protein
MNSLENRILDALPKNSSGGFVSNLAQYYMNRGIAKIVTKICFDEMDYAFMEGFMSSRGFSKMDIDRAFTDYLNQRKHIDGGG